MIYTRTLKEENNQEPVYEHKTSRLPTPADSNHQTTLASGVEKNPLGGLGFAEALQRKEWLAWLTTVQCEAMASMPANTGCSEILGNTSSQACQPSLTLNHLPTGDGSHCYCLKNIPEVKGVVTQFLRQILSSLVWGYF